MREHLPTLKDLPIIMFKSFVVAIFFLLLGGVNKDYFSYLMIFLVFFSITFLSCVLVHLRESIASRGNIKH